MGKYRIFSVTVCTLITAAITITLGHSAAPMSTHWSDRILFAFFIFCIIGYLFRMRIDGRVVIGGMDNAPAIAFGTGLLFLLGLLIPVIIMGLSFSLLLALLLFIIGLTSLFFGINDGPA